MKGAGSYPDSGSGVTIAIGYRPSKVPDGFIRTLERLLFSALALAGRLG